MLADWSVSAAAAAVLGCTGLAGRACGDAEQGRRPLSAVCIGMGSGSLPLFLAHHFPGMQVEAVELDPVVVQAATAAMGFPLDRWQPHYISDTPSACGLGLLLLTLAQSAGRPNLTVHNQDGVAFLTDRARGITSGNQPPIDLLFLDVFNGADDIPAAFTAPGKPTAHVKEPWQT
jgi:hypothetical protein